MKSLWRCYGVSMGLGWLGLFGIGIGMQSGGGRR